MISRHWRAPYGAGRYDPHILEIASSVGFTKHWSWDVDSQDYVTPGNYFAVMKHIDDDLSRCKGQRCIVLLHDIAGTASILPRIMNTLTSRGYRLVDFP